MEFPALSLSCLVEYLNERDCEFLHMNNHAICAATTQIAARRPHGCNRVYTSTQYASEIAGNPIAPLVVMQRYNCNAIYSTRCVQRPAAKYKPAFTRLLVNRCTHAINDKTVCIV